MKATFDVPVITLNRATASGKNATNKQVLPLFDIPEPTDNDVLSGRGVTTNKHAGNVNFRSLVALNKGECYCIAHVRRSRFHCITVVDCTRRNPIVAKHFTNSQRASKSWKNATCAQVILLIRFDHGTATNDPSFRGRTLLAENLGHCCCLLPGSFTMFWFFVLSVKQHVFAFLLSDAFCLFVCLTQNCM